MSSILYFRLEILLRPNLNSGETVPLEGGSVLSAVSATSLLGNASTQDRLQDEYDPARPNEYEAVRRERERLKQEAQQEASRQEELQIAQVGRTARWETSK